MPFGKSAEHPRHLVPLEKSEIFAKCQSSAAVTITPHGNIKSVYRDSPDIPGIFPDGPVAGKFTHPGNI